MSLQNRVVFISLWSVCIWSCASHQTQIRWNIPTPEYFHHHIWIQVYALLHKLINWLLPLISAPVATIKFKLCFMCKQDFLQWILMLLCLVKMLGWYRYTGLQMVWSPRSVWSCPWWKWLHLRKSLQHELYCPRRNFEVICSLAMEQFFQLSGEQFGPWTFWYCCKFFNESLFIFQIESTSKKTTKHSHFVLGAYMS